MITKAIKVILCFIGFLCLMGCWRKVDPLGETPVFGKLSNFVSIDEAKRNVFAVSIGENEIFVLKEPDELNKFYEIKTYNFEGTKIEFPKFEKYFSDKVGNSGCYFVDGENRERFFLLKNSGFGQIFRIREGVGRGLPFWEGKVGTIWHLFPIKGSSDLLIINDSEITWLKDGKIFKRLKEKSVPRLDFFDGGKMIYWGGLDSIRQVNVENNESKKLKVYPDAFGFFPGHLVGYSVRKNEFSLMNIKSEDVQFKSSPLRGLETFQLPRSVMFFRADKKLYLLFCKNGIFKLIFPEGILPENVLAGRKSSEIVIFDPKGMYFFEFDNPEIEF